MSKKNDRRQVSVEGTQPKHGGKHPSVAKQPSANGHLSTEKRQQTKNEKKERTLARGAAIGIAAVVTLGIVALSAYYLIARNSDVLWMAQGKNFFTTNGVFLAECMRQPGGLIAWVASWLTQFFYYPVLGASIMIALWIVSLWLTKWAFRVRMEWLAVLAIPVVCLLVSTVDMGYWLYYIKQTGYWFYGTVGYLVTMLLVLFHSFFRKRMDRIITTLLVAITYPFLGWYTLLALAYIALIAITHPFKRESNLSRILRPFLPILLIGVMPLVCYHLYTEIHLERAWIAGLPLFQNNALTSWYPMFPFVLLAAVPATFPFLSKIKKAKGGMVWMVYLVTAAVMVASWLWVEKRDFQNENYHAEIKMYRATEEQDWDKVLEEMGNISGDASRQMVLLKNVALMNKGEMGTKMFKYNNMGEPPTNGYDTLRVHMVQTAAPLLYYCHGKTNFTVRWCIENSVEFGFNFENLKMLTRCSLVGGEMDAARKYLNILKTSMYYRDWAERMWPITEKPELIKEFHEFDTVRELRDNMGTVLDGDNGLCEMYLLNYFSNTMNRNSKLLQELTLNYALVQKDIQLFWPRFFLYAELHKGEDMPVHYQEAALLYGNLEPDNVDISNMPFDARVKERYQGFQQLSQSLLQSHMKAPEVGEAMKSTYGDTFWWFYFFCRDIHSY